MNEPPTGIIKTLPPCYLDAKSREGAVFQRCVARMIGASDEIFGFSVCSKPKHEILHLYVLCAGAVRWRFNVASIQQASHRCLDNKQRSGTWIYCCGPVIELREPIPMRGFRGFRYTPDL
jgi:hypothetical protein